MEGRSHKAVVNRLHRLYGGTVSSGKGADIQDSAIGTIEVESGETIGEGVRQLQGYRGPVYVAVTTKGAIPRALTSLKNTTVGLLDPEGNIIKPSTRA